MPFSWFFWGKKEARNILFIKYIWQFVTICCITLHCSLTLHLHFLYFSPCVLFIKCVDIMSLVFYLVCLHVLLFILSLTLVYMMCGILSIWCYCCIFTQHYTFSPLGFKFRRPPMKRENERITIPCNVSQKDGAKYIYTYWTYCSTITASLFAVFYFLSYITSHLSKQWTVRGHRNYFFTRNNTERQMSLIGFNWYTMERVTKDRCSSVIIKVTQKQSQRGGARW